MSTTPTTDTTPSTPSTSSGTAPAPPPVDINTDRIVTVTGGILFHMSDVMLHPSDPAPAWITLVPVEESEVERRAREQNLSHWPRERHFRILHDMQVGTVAELVEDYRQKLTRAFHALTHNGGVIPDTGEASLRKQTEVLRRNGCDSSPYGRMPFKVDRGLYQQRQSRREIQQGYPCRQDAFARDMLMRLVATWGSRRFQDPDGSPECSSPTDNPEAVNKLIKALTILRDDYYRADDIAYAQKHGITLDTLTFLANRFWSRVGRRPITLQLTSLQLKECVCWPVKRTDLDNAWLDGSPVKLAGMEVRQGDIGPVLE